MLVSLVAWNNLRERLNPTKESFYGIAFLIEFQIKPGCPPRFGSSPGPPVDRGVVLDSSFPVIMTNFLGVVGCVCGGNRVAILHIVNLKCFERRFLEPGIMNISKCNRAGKRETG